MGNFTVNRAVMVEVGSGIELRYIVDMAEIPAFTAIREIDADADGATSDAERMRYTDAACTDAGAALDVRLDGSAASLRRRGTPSLTFPVGAGGLQTLRLECPMALHRPLVGTSRHTLTVVDRTDDPRVGWREMTARAVEGARIVASDVPERSESEQLTRYPEDRLQAPSDVRRATITFMAGGGGSGATTAEQAAPGGPRQTADDALASLVRGDLSPAVVGLALAVALGLGALHALSPGHGKTLVAAYVLGAGASGTAAMQIGLSVAASHTVGVFALGVVTLLESELFLPERVIAWLSLGSGVIVAGLGVALLARHLVRIARPAVSSDPHEHRHADRHGHDHGHGHRHLPANPGLTCRSAIALGFAGGAVPSASAVIVLLVAISSDRLILGTLLIVAFGIGMAVVLGGLGAIVARLGSAASSTARPRWMEAPWVQRVARAAPIAAGLVVMLTGIAFAVIAAAQLA